MRDVGELLEQASGSWRQRRRVGVWLRVIVVSVRRGRGLWPRNCLRKRPEDKLYFAAKERLDAGSCNGAIDYYEKLQGRYPFGAYAPQAQLELAYCHYKSEELPKAIAAVDRFMKLNPTHPSMDYAFYLRGLINFNTGKGAIERHLARDASQRDPGASLKAFNDFSELIKRFPDSRYVADSQLRMRFLRNILAQPSSGQSPGADAAQTPG